MAARTDYAGQIAKFDGTNYQLWKFSISIILKAEKLLPLVDGSEPRPPNTEQDKLKAWEERNAKAQVILLTSITQNQVQYLVNCEDASQMWAKFTAIHEQKTDISRELLWQRFYDYRMADNDRIADHISKIESLVKQLKDVQENLSESAVCSKILNSLPTKYNAFRTAWDSVAQFNQTTENLTARLLKEESRMDSAETETNKLALEVQALQAKLESMQVNKQSEGKASGKPDIKELKKRTTCNYCKKKGHWSRECRKRLSDAAKNNTNSAFVCDISALYSTSSDDSQREWICDSGASVHMTNQLNWFKVLKPLDKQFNVKVANDKIIQATGIGTIEILAEVKGKWIEKEMQNVLYIPDLKRSLFSVGVMTDLGFTHHAFQKSCEFRDQEGQIVCVGERKGNLWIMKFRPNTVECNLTKGESLKLWHDRLGHINFKSIMSTVKNDSAIGLDISDSAEFFCETCKFGKQSAKPHKRLNREKVYESGEMVHTDVCGPMNIESPRGSRYFVLFKDEKTGYRVVYFLRHKSEVLNKFKEYKAMSETQTGHKLKVVRSDQGKGEYMNSAFQDFLKQEGILHEVSAPYTPQQNGRSEREIRTIVESARSMLINKNLSKELWAEAVNTAVYVLNRTISTLCGDITSFEGWFGRKPEVKHLKVFGCTAYMSVPSQFRKKWDKKSRKLIFVGYEGYSKNYRLWDPHKRRIETSSNVVFNEEDELKTQKQICTIPLSVQENDEFSDAETEENQNEPPELEIPDEGRVLRNRDELRPPDFYGPAVTYCSIIEPLSFEQAIKSEDRENWKEAMNEEIAALKDNDTWELVQKPENVKIVDNKWVFRLKTDSSGQTTRFKARLVAKGYTQQKDIDYSETFAPVVRYDSIRILLALAAEECLEIAQFDVKTAFLYGDLQEAVYMKQPNGFEHQNQPNTVCKLKKSLYGLKQSPKCWNKKFVEFLKNYKFEQLKGDQCVFKGILEENVIYIALYVDDGLVLSKSKHAINALMKHLQDKFKVTYDIEGDVKQFVGMQITHNSQTNTVILHQKPYIQKLLEKFNLKEANPVAVPAEPGLYLQAPEDNLNYEKKQPYREAVGSLIFVATVSRPDISYAVSQVSRFLNNWTDDHWIAVKRIFRYLKGTINYKISYTKSSDTMKANIQGFTDADFAGCRETRKSTSGYIFIMGNGPITWKSQKQNVVAQSTTEAEYLALALGTREALWLQSFLRELGFEASPMQIGVDNQSTIKLTQAHQFHPKTKHIDIKVHFVRDESEKGNIRVSYVKTSDQIADMLTKPLAKAVLENLIKKLNVTF